ncbi:hypothetical protein BJY27_007834 [Streptomyces rapamycinicus]|uniref:IstB-like ATP-binding domain-containing protein n=1 Tax=Streptomyces rapamycinicus TaxID=1226757 RepID=A0ABR6LZ73_9ACTN|nr:hypothetical protein [Streptomyces rapamycinicus]
MIGDSGTGKSHLLIGIGTAMAEAGLRVRYTTTVNLVNELAEAADEKKLTRLIARYGRVDLLCLDEFGYLDLDKAGPSCCSRSSPSARRGGPSRSRQTPRSRSGSRPSPIPVSARRSWTGSPSTRTSSRPEPSPTGSPRASGSVAADLHRQPRPASLTGGRPQPFRARPSSPSADRAPSPVLVRPSRPLGGPRPESSRVGNPPRTCRGRADGGPPRLQNYRQHPPPGPAEPPDRSGAKSPCYRGVNHTNTRPLHPGSGAKTAPCSGAKTSAYRQVVGLVALVGALAQPTVHAS